MLNNRTVLFTALLLLTASCSSDPLQEMEEVRIDDAAATKIVNTPEVSGNTLAVYFDEAAIPTLEQAAKNTATRAARTRSGINDMDEILAGLEIKAFGRIFPETQKHEAATRAAGLHRWYLLEFAHGEDLVKAARMLAPVAEIQTIQFCRELKKASDCKTYPFREEASRRVQTRTMLHAEFNDPNLFWQWHYINNADQAIATTSRVGADIGVADAWKLTTGDPRVIVAVIDEGVKYTHPDLAANMWVNPSPSPEYGYQDIHGYNFMDGGPITWNVDGDSGHGTHVAGTVAAVNNNGIGVCGVAGGSGHNDGVRIMSCQIFSGKNKGTDVHSSQAIKYAADHGASILQCSYGYTSSSVRTDNAYESNSPLEKAAINYFMAQKNCAALDGGLVIYASGNEGVAMSSYPGAYRNHISVTAFAPDFLPAYYTNYGLGCNIAAPGGETTGLSGKERAGILSTLCSETNDGDDYGYMQGTSMACPHVSGVAALGLSYALAKGKHFSLDEFNAMILTSVNDIDQYLGDGVKISGEKIFLSDYYQRMGTGAIDAYQLLMQIEGTPCLKVAVGDVQFVSLDGFFGGAADKLTYTKIEMSEADMQRLGMTAAPQINNGKLMIRCTTPGTAKIRIFAVAGGNRPGSENSMGGMTISKEFSIIARSVNSQNGGWL